MTSTNSMNARWFIIAGIFLFLGFFSFCAAHRIYTLENKEPKIITEKVPTYIEVAKSCPSPPPIPECTPTPTPLPSPFQVLSVEKQWDADGRYRASYQVIIPADDTWHDSEIEVSHGVTMIWNYDKGYSGGLSVKVGRMEYTKYRPLDYEKAFFERKFIKQREYGGAKDEIVLESPRNIEFKALEQELVIRVELWEQY